MSGRRRAKLDVGRSGLSAAEGGTLNGRRPMKRVIGLAAVAVVLIGPAPIAARAGAERDPLDEARRAAEQTPFSGSVTLQWREASVLHQDQLTVRGTHGTLLAEGQRSAMAVGGERLVYDPGNGWQELWPSALGSTGRPSLTDAYDVRPAGSDTVAGYKTDVVEVLKGGTVRERLDLETNTKLLLRRRQYDARGTLERAFTFERVQIGDTSMTPPTTPPTPKQSGPHALRLGDVPSSEREPSRLAAGYQRVGAYQQAGVVQMVYSDGLYDLSLFQEEGGLDTSDLPAQRRTVHLAGHQAWAFSWPGGEGIVWDAGRTVYTLVGDVPPDELTTVAASVPVHHSTSVAHRLRQACRELVESFTGGL
jgi:negative regulator of sigma E activity